MNNPRGLLFPSPKSPQRASASVAPGRNKVALAPGHSLMDWIRLGRSGEDLTGVGTHSLRVTPEELAKHNKEDDAWLALRGKVYNVTRYMDFHPGGISELMRGAGKDATDLFDEIHKWVNAESMLEKCLVGPLVTDQSSRRGSTTSRGSNTFLNPNGISTVNLKVPSGPQPPSMDWFQNTKTVTIVVYTKWSDMQSEFVIIDREQDKLLLTFLLKEHAFHVHKELEESVTDDYTVRVGDSGKVEVLLQKTVPDKHWSDLGKSLDRHNSFIKLKDRSPTIRKCQVSSISQVTHDTKLFKISLPAGTRMCVPVGYHIRVKHTIDDVELVRSYTVVLPSLSTEDEEQRSGKAFYLMVKIYAEGAISSWLGSLEEGASVEVSDFDGSFKVQSLHTCTHLVLLAAGSGFTPMVRLLYHTLVADLPGIREVKLFFFNKTREDIMWHDELQQLAERNSKFHFISVLSEPDAEWTGLTGRVREELLQEEIPQEEDGIKTLVCACGPTPFTKTAMSLVTELGVREESCHAFLG